MQQQTQFSIYLINQPGVLGQVAAALAKGRVNVAALALMDSGEHGTLRLVCDDAERAREILRRTHDHWTECEVLVVQLENKPGAFANVCARLGAEHVNITYAYCTGGSAGGRTTAVFKVGELQKAQKVLASIVAARQHKSKARAKQSLTVKKAPRARG